jgi:hypothetical protein
MDWKISSTDGADVERRDLRRTLQETRETERAFDSVAVAERNLLGRMRSGRAASTTASSKESEDPESSKNMSSIEGDQRYHAQVKSPLIIED